MGKGNFNSSRRLGRILAFQGLYSWDVGGISKEDVLSLSWAQEDDVEDGQGADSKEPVSMETAVFARVLIDGAINNQEKIDSLISGHLSGWEFNRVNKVSMAILRMSVYSLLFQPEIDSSIVINEAVEIAKQFGQDDSFRFVNAVLDNIKKSFKNAENSGSTDGK